MLAYLHYFLVSQFIWMITFGIYHIPLTMLWMFLLFKFWDHVRLVPAILMSFFANITVVMTLVVLVRGIVFGLFDYVYIPAGAAYKPWVASLSFALTCMVIQSLFFVAVSKKYKGLHLYRICVIVVMSNLMSAVLVYKLLPRY